MNDSQRPYYIEHLADCVNRMTYYRDVSTYETQNRSNPGASLHDLVRNEIIVGNLGCLVFQSDDQSYGVEWIAPSFKAKDYIKEVTASGEASVLIEAHDNEIRARFYPQDIVENFPVTLAATDNSRTHDSEFLLLNFFDYLASSNRIPIKGRLSLVTERIPCKSCTKIIEKFTQKYCEISIDVFYMHDTKDRQPQDFLTSVGNGDVQLIKIAVHTVVSLIKVSKNPCITVSPLVREQRKMFGGAPNQIIQAVGPSS